VLEALPELFQVPPEHSASAPPRKKFTALVAVAVIMEVAAHMTALEAGVQATQVEQFFPPAQGSTLETDTESSTGLSVRQLRQRSLRRAPRAHRQ
jgi:hypothetical protein